MIELLNRLAVEAVEPVSQLEATVPCSPWASDECVVIGELERVNARQLNGRGSQYERGQARNGDRRWQTSTLGEIPGQGDRSPSREGCQKEEGGQEKPDAVVGGSRHHPEHREGQEMDQEIERQPVAANLTKCPHDADRCCKQDGHRNRDSEQHPGIVPGERVLVSLAKVDNLDIGKGGPAITA